MADQATGVVTAAAAAVDAADVGVKRTSVPIEKNSAERITPL
jgi:hypothetical protein